MDRRKKALIISVDTGEYDTELSVRELESLCESAGLTAAAVIEQKREAPDPAFFIGSGKLQEASRIVTAMEIELAVADGELTSAQQRGIEDMLDIPVVDRTTVILDIFAKNAVTKEGAIQVELAQLRYRLPRLTGSREALSRLGGGIGTRGPGETKLETDRRHIMRRIRSLREQLCRIEEHRGRTAARREKNEVPIVALAGYTNAGKSTLLNKLTGSSVLAEDRLFATLDPTARSLVLPGGTTAVVIDTVGFIQRIPHHLIEAFQSTLRNLTDADVILNVCDASSPDADVHTRVTLSLLRELGCEGTPVINVLNKWDLLGEPMPAMYRDTVAVSSVTGEGIDVLLHAISEHLGVQMVTAELLIPYGEDGKVSRLRESAEVVREEYKPEGISLTVTSDAAFLDGYKDYLMGRK